MKAWSEAVEPLEELVEALRKAFEKIEEHKRLLRRPLGECQIVAENTDGSLCAHIPVAWIKINPTYQLTEEQREQRAETMRRNFQK